MPAPGPGPGTAPIAVLTGEYGALVLGPLVDSLARDDIRLVPVANQFFGGNIGVSGLLTGTDLVDVLNGQPEGHRYLLPDSCLSEGRFLDDLTIADLPRPVEVVPTDGLSLRRALDGPAPSPSTRCRVARDGPRHRPGCRSPWEQPPDDHRRGRGGREPGASGRWWSSPDGPTSASRRWSIASWAGGPPSSRSGPGSPATARSSTPSGADTPSRWWTPVGGSPPPTRSTPK